MLVTRIRLLMIIVSSTKCTNRELWAIRAFFALHLEANHGHWGWRLPRSTLQILKGARVRTLHFEQTFRALDAKRVPHATSHIFTVGSFVLAPFAPCFTAVAYYISRYRRRLRFDIKDLYTCAWCTLGQSPKADCIRFFHMLIRIIITWSPTVSLNGC